MTQNLFKRLGMIWGIILVSLATPAVAQTGTWTVTERSETRVTIEVTRCYRWEAFRLLGTPEAASAACAFEEHMMNASPRLRLTTSSMATGADRCRFCFERQLETAH